MESKHKRIAVLGGGFCGILCLSMLKEEGLDAICFEKTDKVGGTWCYREKSVVGVPSIMPTTVINHSKELGALSNFPPRKEFNNYMRHFELYQYIMEYATKNDVLKQVRLNSEVVKVRRSTDYDSTGRWVVTVRDAVTGEEFQDTYDGVLVGVGHINHPKMSSYPGMETFQGKIMHTHSLKGVSEYKDQTVVVVGMGCSGLDAAAEISTVAKQVYLSTRSGAYVISRVGPYGFPIDYVLLRRCITVLLDILPIRACSWIIETFFVNTKFDRSLYNVKPKNHVLSKDPIFNDQLASRLLSGSVIQMPDIKCFTKNGVIFESVDEEVKADTVIMATGYEWKAPFLEDNIIQIDKGKINLYRCMWPIQLKHATLAIMGFLLPFGPGFPLGELQARWAAQILAEKGKLPPVEDMVKELNDRHNRNLKRYSPSDKMSIKVDYTQYQDELASEIGVKPNLLKLFFTDFWLCMKLLFGPSVSYQYRLQGPHSWPGARDAIMNVNKRLHYPLNGKDV